MGVNRISAKCFGCELNHPVDELGFHQGIAPADVTACRRHDPPPTPFAVCERAFYNLLQTPLSQHAQQRGELLPEIQLALAVLLGSEEATLACQEWLDDFSFPLDRLAGGNRELTLLVEAIRHDLTLHREVPSFLGLTDPDDRTHPFWFLSDCGLPVEVFEALIGKMKALLSGHLLAAAYEDVDALTEEDPAFHAALTKVVIFNLRSYLRLLASHVGSDVPETLIPPSNRFDLVALGAECRATLAAFEVRLASIVSQIETDGF